MAAGLFGGAGIISADLDARILVAAACGIDHACLVRDPDEPIGAVASALLAAWISRRLDREPVSRILGRRDFWGLTFAITPDVLDPRAETEGLVGAVIDAVGGRRDSPLAILDLGTGSGAILCALLHEFSGATGVGIDRSEAACGIARHNLGALGFESRASVVCGDWSDPLRGTFDVVVSNPPYIPADVVSILDRDVRDYDPLLALDGGRDGLTPYRAIAPRLAGLLRHDGVAAFECGWDQGEALVALLDDALVGLAIHRDLAGHDRVLIGQRRAEGTTSPRSLRLAKPLGLSTENL